MAFYSPDGAMAQRLAEVVAQLGAEGRPELEEQLSITWLRYGSSLLQSGAGRSPQKAALSLAAALCSSERS